MGLFAENTCLIAALSKIGVSQRFDHLARRLRAELIADGGHLLKLLPRPIFSDPEDVAELGRRSNALLELQTRLISSMIAERGREAFLDYFAVRDHNRRFVNWNELAQPSYLIARLDLLRMAGGYKCCEINVDSCVAGAEIFDTARDAFSALGLPAAAMPERPLDRLAAFVTGAARQRGAERIVILDWSVGGGSGGKGYLSYERMRAAVARAGNLPVFVVNEQTYPPSWLTPQHAPSTFVHRGFMMEEMDDGGMFLDYLLSAGTPVLSTYEANVRMDKGWFALFWDALRAGRLNSRDSRLVEEFVPETWQIDESSCATLIARKDELIFKTRRSFGGAGILIGNETQAPRIRAALRATGMDAWIAQQMLCPERLNMPHAPGSAPEPHEIVYGLYLYGTDVNGLLLRGSTRSRIVNVTTGNARLSWAMAVESSDRLSLLMQLGADL